MAVARARPGAVAILMLCVMAGPLLVACDPGTSLSARNDTGHVIVFVVGDRYLPMGPGEAEVFGSLGQPEGQSIVGILDDACTLIANVTVDWVATPDAFIEVPAQGVPTVGGISGRDLPSAYLSEAWGMCDSPGLTFWVSNPTSDTYYVREAGADALVRVPPGVAGVAFSYVTDEGWFELLDTSCHVVARYHHTGHGIYLGTISAGSLSVHQGPFPSTQYASLWEYDYDGEGCPSTT